MLDLKNILVPVDFSAGSRAALRYAADLAEKFGANIEVLHAWYTPEYISPSVAVHAVEGPPETLGEHMRREAQAQLVSFVNSCELPENLELTMTFEMGREPEVIAQAAKRHDLVVMGTAGRSGLSRLFMGSVTESVIRRTSCPVLAIKSPPPDGESP